jgi:hypothetical protein
MSKSRGTRQTPVRRLSKLPPERRVPKVVYHYTSANGLLGMFLNRSIWATDCTFLNDSDELRQADRMVQSLVSSKLSKHKFKRKIQNWISDFSSYSALTASFSEDGDLLSQWRAYCPTDGGYSIGFEKEFWRKLEAPFSFQFQPCVYEQKQQSAILEDLLASSEGDLGRFDLYYRSQRPRMKHESFREEREWRILSLDPPEIIDGLSFRPSNGRLIPYFPMKFRAGRLPVKEVIIGPCRDPQLSAGGLRHFLNSFGARDIDIRSSKVTLR